MAKELPPKPEENLDELIPGFVKEKQEVRSPYKFQTLEELTRLNFLPVLVVIL